MRTVRPWAVRVTAVLVAAILIVPAIAECAGWMSSAAGRHVCCGGRGGMASETSMTDCCAMSQQSNDAIPPDTQAARPSLKLLDHYSAQFADLSFSGRAPVLDDVRSARRGSLIPLYLTQASLLI